jgi:hypothetical protein
MYRACSTWQYGVASQILERYRDARRLGFVEGIYFDSKVEPDPEVGAWRVLKAHDAHERFAEELATGRALALYSYRDLRDVIYSYMHKTGSSFEQLLERGFFELCLENDRFWRSRPGLLVQSYESLIAEPVRGVLEIAGHLGVELAEGEAEAIAESLSFESNRRKTADLTAQLEADGQHLTPEDQSRFDPVSLLHWNHIRKGGTGTWRELASPRHRAIMARFLGPWLAQNGYEADDSLETELSDAEFLQATRRHSYARNQEDILLDRLFRGHKGTYLDLDAADPIRGNSTYYFYIRGWRGSNFGSRDRPLERFVLDRPLDRTLALEPVIGDTTDRASGRGLAKLIDEHRIVPPDIVSIADESDPVGVLLGLPLATWRPKVFVIDASRTSIGDDTPPSWEPILLWHGYLFAASNGINRFYLRDDLADSLAVFGSPVNELDNYECMFSAEELARVEEDRENAPVVAVGTPTIPFADLLRERDDWQMERDAFQRERDANQRERDSIQRERDSRQVERDARQVERDSIQVERDAVQRERDAFQRERDVRISERTLALAEIAEARQKADRLQLEVDRLEALLSQERIVSEADRARWELERAEFEKRAEEAESIHRPYRLIDRFGVVSAIHRRATRPFKSVRS